MKIRLPTMAEIQSRAYQLYLARGCEHGHDLDDWLQAEYELMQLPLHKVAELPAIVVEKKDAKQFRLVRLACEVLKPKKRSSKQTPPLWYPEATSPAGISSNA